MKKSIKIYQIDEKGKEHFIACTDVEYESCKQINIFQSQLLKDNIRVEFC